MNQFKKIHGEVPNEPPREWNIQIPASNFKSRTSPPKISPVVSDIMERLNPHSIESGDVEVHPSEFPVQSNSESGPNPDTTLIKSVGYDEMDHLLQLFHS